MFIQQLQIRSHIPHQTRLQAIIVEMFHIRNVRCSTFWVFGGFEERDTDGLRGFLRIGGVNSKVESCIADDGCGVVLYSEGRN